MKLNSLRDLYLEQLEDVFDAENQLVKALPKMAGAASEPELKQAFEEHLEQTKGHVERLEKVFKMLGESPKRQKCEGMAGLIKEGEEVMESAKEKDVCDAALIAAAQRVEHYEIAAYGTLRTFAEQLGEDDAIELLEQTLDEEKDTDARLTEIAESTVNEEAASSEGGKKKPAA